MSKVLDFFRAEDKRFETVSDERLVRFIADTQPEFLQDKEFLAEYNEVHPPSASLQPVLQMPEPTPTPVPYAQARAVGKERPFAPELAEFPLSEQARQRRQQHMEGYADLNRRATAWRQMAGDDPAKLRAINQAFRQEGKRMGVTILEEKSILQTATEPIVSLRNMLPELSDLERAILPTRLQIAYGTLKGVASTADFFLSPLGIATLGIGGLPAATQRAIAAAFTADMALHTPELAKELGKALGEGNPERAAELTTSAALNTYFLAKTGGKALGDIRTRAEMSKMIGEELLARIEEIPPEGTDISRVLVEQQAAAGGRPIETEFGTVRAETRQRIVGEWRSDVETFNRLGQEFEKLQAAGQGTSSELMEIRVTREEIKNKYDGRDPNLVDPEEAVRMAERRPPPAAPGPETATSRRMAARRRTEAERPPDIIDDFQGQVGRKLSISSARQFREDFKPEKGLKKIFSEQGLALDDALAALHRQGLHRNIQTEDQFLDAILEADRVRSGGKAAASREERILAEEEARRVAFDEAMQPQADPNVKPMAARDFYAGDEFEVRGNPMRIRQMASDEDTGDVINVLLDGGAKFGEHWVPADQLLYPDADTIKSKPVEFEPAEPDMPAVLRDDPILAEAWQQGYLDLTSRPPTEKRVETPEERREVTEAAMWRRRAKEKLAREYTEQERLAREEKAKSGSAQPLPPAPAEPVAAQGAPAAEPGTPKPEGELQRGAAEPAAGAGRPAAPAPEAPEAGEPTIQKVERLEGHRWEAGPFATLETARQWQNANFADPARQSHVRHRGEEWYVVSALNARKPRAQPAAKAPEPAAETAGEEGTVPARAISAEDSVRIANRIRERIEEIDGRLKEIYPRMKLFSGDQLGVHYKSLSNEARYLEGQVDTLEKIWRNFKDDAFTRSGEIFASKPSASPGGPLGAGPARPADNPNFTIFPVELPEAVRLARDLMGGKYPKLAARLQALGGRAAGIFRRTGPKSAEIHMRGDLFDLPPERKMELYEEAARYAKATAGPGDDVGKIARERYEFLRHEALMQNPVQALKVLWHEIWHLVDWLPEHIIEGRGNLLGRVASLKNYLKNTIPEEPGLPHKPITPYERTKLMKEAEAELRKELGPIEEIIKGILVDEPIYRVSGVTPEDVKALLGMSAREQMPELYRWFAEQPAEVKKAILKAAMKGMVDERLTAMQKREQIGTEKVYRKMRMKRGREPTPEEIRERFHKLFRAEMKKRRLVELDQIRKELEPLIAWWRGTEKMEDYFKPSAEMYAEAGSIFMNNPAAMAERAPTYWKMLHSYMERKPEVKKLYDQIQDQIRSGTVMRGRVEELRASWRKDEEQSLAKLAQRGKLQAGEFLENVIYHFDRRFGPVYRRAKGYSQEGELRDAIGGFNYRASEHELFLGRINRAVGQRLVSAGLDWMDLGEYMFHKHVTENRAAIGNPMGWTPKNSLERLAEMRTQYGPAGFKALEEAQARFRQIYETQVVELLNRVNMFGPELTEAINERTYYATFAALRDPSVLTIERLLKESFGDGTSAHIYKQVGNLGEIKNPATATVLKSLSLISAAYRNHVKRQTVAMLHEMDPSGIMPAKVRWTGKRLEHVIEETDKVGTLVYLDGGKPRAFYVRKGMADAINKSNPIENSLYLAAVKANQGLKEIFTQLNYAFWPAAFVRDAAAWMMQLPGIATPAYWAKLMPRAVAAANASLSNRRTNPDAEAALKRKMIISRADPRGLASGGIENEFEARLASFGVDPVQWNAQADKVHLLLKAWNKYREFGQRFERAHKIAGMLYLDERFPKMSEWKKREIVRERSGSPDFLQRGAGNPWLDLFAMFYNPWKEGIRSLAKSARENPWSFGAKATALVMLPTVTQAMAASGAFGDELHDLYRSIPDYDLTNYLVIPLGWADQKQKKVAYLRLPLWEPARIAHGLTWQTLTSRGQGYASYLGGQVPSANPLIGVAAAWWNHEVLGKNPYDAFLGREILDPDVFEAGGWRARQDLARWTWNELGGSIVARFQERPLDIPDDTDLEKFLKLPIVSNALGRWLKVSNRGLADADRKLTAELRQDRAQTRLAVETIMDKMIAREALTNAEKQLLRDPYALEYFRTSIVDVMKKRSHPLLRRLDKAGSKTEKQMILENELQEQQR